MEGEWQDYVIKHSKGSYLQRRGARGQCSPGRHVEPHDFLLIKSKGLWAAVLCDRDSSGPSAQDTIAD